MRYEFYILMVLAYLVMIAISAFAGYADGERGNDGAEDIPTWCVFSTLMGMGIAMAITAFPVLARILSDKRLVRTELGAIALSCAATGDVTAWCLLAFVVGVAKSEVGGSLMVAAGTFAFIAGMVLLVRPVLARVVQRWHTERLPRGGVAFVLVLLLLSAITTEAIGIHAIFGAFILGAVIPRDSAVLLPASTRRWM